MEDTIRVVRDATCPSLSGRSTLSYEVGAGPNAETYLRLTKNTGNGYFNTDWVSWESVRQVLQESADRPITFYTLGPLFEGKSVNTAGFLLAVLKGEGLVQRRADNPRVYECVSPGALVADAPAPAAKPKRVNKKG